jgi:3-dehydrotetronate 4-kinase
MFVTGNRPPQNEDAHPVLGCIADDFTGATDLANNLVRAGMRVVLTVDVPTQKERIDADAVVVALKSRTVAASAAVAQSLRACRWLRDQGARQIYFKVCSTFDSTAAGNIGPVIEALMEELDCDFSIATPAFPETGRTVVHGHLFVGDTLLSDSGMRHHPLTPMTDANLVRVLQAQLHAGKGRRVGLVDYRVVSDSAEAIRRRMDELRAEGVAVAIVDALNKADLDRLGEALRNIPFLTASSGLGDSLPRNWGFSPSNRVSLPPTRGYKAILAGSCSVATNAQVQRFIRDGGEAYALEPMQLAADIELQIARVLAWADACWRSEAALPLLVYSTAEPARVGAAHAQLGAARCGAIVEQAMSALARAFVQRGVGSLVVAGGETAGICVQALDIQQMQIGPQIDPGVPWCYAASSASSNGGLHLALKSGNFGAPDFFNKAFALVA